MCLACLEYIKGGLKLNELKSALREFVRDDKTKSHAEKVQSIIYDNKDTEDDLRNSIQAIADQKD